MLLFSIVLIFNYLLSFCSAHFLRRQIYLGNTNCNDSSPHYGDKMPDQSGYCWTPSRILRMPELSQLLGISRSTIYEKMNPLSKYYDATFPRPVRLGSGSVGWRSSAIDEWLTLHTVPARSAVKGVNDEVRHTLSSDMTMSR